MNRSLLALVGCLALGIGPICAEVPWAGKLKPDTPGSFPAIKPFTGEFRFGWSNIEAASATAKFTEKENVMNVDVAGGTTGLARALWMIDATHREQFYPAGLRPIGFEQVERYANRTVTTKCEFRPDGLWRQRSVVPGKDQNGKWKKVKVQPIRDFISGMLFIRSQPLADGDKVVLILYPGDSPFFTEVTVLGREEIRVGDRTFKAIKLDFHPQRIVKGDDNKYHMEPHRKFTRGTAWISDDAYRMPLRVEVNIFIGYVFGELKSARFEDGTVLP